LRLTTRSVFNLVLSEQVHVNPDQTLSLGVDFPLPERKCGSASAVHESSVSEVSDQEGIFTS